MYGNSHVPEVSDLFGVAGRQWLQSLVQQSLLAKLINAKRKLEAGQTTVAKNMLDAFLHEVLGVSCLEFTCPGNKPLTSEAFALLFFNGQFLVERLR